MLLDNVTEEIRCMLEAKRDDIVPEDLKEAFKAELADLVLATRNQLELKRKLDPNSEYELGKEVELRLKEWVRLKFLTFAYSRYKKIIEEQGHKIKPFNLFLVGRPVKSIYDRFITIEQRNLKIGYRVKPRFSLKYLLIEMRTKELSKRLGKPELETEFRNMRCNLWLKAAKEHGMEKGFPDKFYARLSGRDFDFDPQKLCELMDISQEISSEVSELYENWLKEWLEKLNLLESDETFNKDMEFAEDNIAVIVGIDSTCHIEIALENGRRLRNGLNPLTFTVIDNNE